jgi:hypothetical protein
MASQLGRLEVDCDAPAYTIVRACNRLGMYSPEDVRWCRMAHYLNAFAGWRGLFNRHAWKLLWETTVRAERVCFCGGQLPSLMMYTFTLNTGEELSYYLGQCGKCHTVFWEQVPAPQEV